jgi:hypothetical protein
MGTFLSQSCSSHRTQLYTTPHNSYSLHSIVSYPVLFYLVYYNCFCHFTSITYCTYTYIHSKKEAFCQSVCLSFFLSFFLSLFLSLFLSSSLLFIVHTNSARTYVLPLCQVFLNFVFTENYV